MKNSKHLFSISFWKSRQDFRDLRFGRDRWSRLGFGRDWWGGFAFGRDRWRSLRTGCYW